MADGAYPVPSVSLVHLIKQSSPCKVGARAEIASHTIDPRYIHSLLALARYRNAYIRCTMHIIGTLARLDAPRETETKREFTILDRDRNACK